MAVARKPKALKNGKQDVDIDALINKGGSVATDAEPKTTAFTIRLPGDLLQRVDTAVKKRPLKTPRHTWVLEAILEKLERESERKHEAIRTSKFKY